MTVYPDRQTGMSEVFDHLCEMFLRDTNRRMTDEVKSYEAGLKMRYSVKTDLKLQPIDFYPSASFILLPPKSLLIEIDGYVWGTEQTENRSHQLNSRL